MVDITSTRVGKSNLRRFGGRVAPFGFEFRSGLASDGVVRKNLPTMSLTNSVTSYRGSRGRTSSDDTPGSLIRANIEVNSKPKTDSGHPFRTRKEEFYVSLPRTTVRGPTGSFYTGPCYTTAGSSHPALQDWGFTGIAQALPKIELAYGTTAIANCEPSKSSVSLVRSIAELVIDFPKMPFTALGKSRSWGEVARNLGSEHLNLTFGVTPTVKDIIALCQAVITCGDKLAQAQRDMGKPVRRSFTFPDASPKTVTDTRVYSGTQVYAFIEGPYALDYWSTSKPFIRTHTQTDTEKYWFAGAFEFYLDPLLEKLGPLGDFYAKASYILGLDASVATLWALTPWTWLLDWFYNVSDLITVNEKLANHSLVLRYGYLMRTFVRELRVEMSGLTPSGESVPTSLTSTYRITEKQRVRATPYGFGITAGEFSTSQWAILGALGLSSGNKLLL